jgi:hypothetical protein
LRVCRLARLGADRQHVVDAQQRIARQRLGIDGDENRRGRGRRRRGHAGVAFGRQHVMGFVDDDPMRTPGAAAQLGDRGKEAREHRWPVGDGNREHIDDDAFVRPFNHLEDLGQMRRRLGVAHDDDRAQMRIVALRIENADLESGRDEALEQRRRERGLAAARQARDQDAPP